MPGPAGTADAKANRRRHAAKGQRKRGHTARPAVRACKTGRSALQNGPCSTAKRHISQGGTARFATAGRPATQPAAGQAVCRSRPVGAKTARHPGCGSKAPKAETTHSRPQYKAKGAAPHDATPSKNPNLFISYRNITVIACFKMRRAASRIATRRQPRQHNAPDGMRPGHGRCHACKDKYHITIIASLDARISQHIAYKPHNPQNRTIIMPDKGHKSQQQARATGVSAELPSRVHAALGNRAEG